MVDITWPPATLPLTGFEEVPAIQGGKMVSVPAGTFGSGGGGGGAGGTVAVASYATIRANTYPTAVTALVLTDPNKGGVFVRSTTVGLLDNGGTQIKDASGQVWTRLYSERVSAAWFYNGPGYLGDYGTTAITSTDQTNNPQWIGLPAALGGGPYPVGTTWAYVAVQECTYACLASASVPGTVTWNASNSNKNLAMWLPSGYMQINQPWYFCANGFDIAFAQRKGFLVWTGSQNQAPVQMDAIAYGVIHNLSVSDGVGVISQPLVDCNWTGANPGLKTQNLTFDNLTLYGGFAQHGSVGLYIARSGAASQGDTVVLINPGIFYVNQAIIMGGDNALNLTIIGGNIQSAMRDGATTYGGSFQYYNMSWQAAAVDYHVYPQSCQLTLDGADAHIYPGGGQTARCCLRDTRSENAVMSLDQNGSTRIDNASQVQAYGINAGAWGPSAHQHIGFVIGTGAAINQVAVLCDDGGPAWFPADPTSTNTVMVHQPPSPGWTVNQWAGYARWFRFSNGYCFAGLVDSNTANTVTSLQGWYTPEPPTILVPPLGGYFVKIMGVSGTTEPAWDSYPPGNYSLGGGIGGSPGYGFTTGAGSNVVSTFNPVTNGQYMMVCGAVGVQAPPGVKAQIDGGLFGKVQNVTAGASFTASLAANGVLTVTAMTSGSIKIGAALLGAWGGTVIQSQTSGTPNGVGVYQVSNPTQPPIASGAFSTQAAFELVNSLGEPMNATYAITDANGYWGTGIPDGPLVWLPLDFNNVAGAASIDAADIGGFGKFYNCGLVSLAEEVDLFSLSRYRQPQTGNTNYTLRNGSSIAQVLPSQILSITAPTTITTLQLSEQSNVTFANGLAAFNVNMPTWLVGVIQDFRIIINNTSAGSVLTWGTNVAAVNPTVNLGASGTVTTIILTWGIKANVWVVAAVEGPF